MAQFFLLNTTRSKGTSGPKTFVAGAQIDSTKMDTSVITGAGGLLVAVGDANVAAAAAIAQTRKLQGAQTTELDAIMLAAGLKQLGLT